MDAKIGMIVSLKANAKYVVLCGDGNLQSTTAAPFGADYMVVATHVSDREVVDEDVALQNTRCNTVIYANSSDLINFRGFCPKCGNIASYCKGCKSLHCSCR